MSTMDEAVLVDLIHGPCLTCIDTAVLDESAPDTQVFLLSGTRNLEDNNNRLSDKFPESCRRIRVLDSDSTAGCLFRFKQILDQLQISTIRVFTSAQGLQVLRQYQDQLFTAVYTFEYDVMAAGKLTCLSCRGSAHSDSPAQDVEEEVSGFVQQLPGLLGDITVLKSTLIPECFGHGFSSRPGGVSYIPTLSSLNLFCSSKRRDSRAVVLENRRRLALHAGFHPRPLHFPKVDHANDIWVMGKPEPEDYDGIVTNQTGVVLAAPGADCMPILFADPVSKVIGATHAGWRGTLMGAAMATVDAMVMEFGCQVSDIVVAVGPSVGACCFTLDRDHALEFHQIHPDCVRDPELPRPHVDIRLANRMLLQKGGILSEHIHDHTVTDRPCVTPCTSCHPESFFSHVRDGVNFGTQVGFLWIKEEEEEAKASAGKSASK